MLYVTLSKRFYLNKNKFREIKNTGIYVQGHEFINGKNKILAATTRMRVYLLLTNHDQRIL